jgi:hypothetical protein
MLQLIFEHALIRLMRTSDVLDAFDGDKEAVAKALGISISAVYQWGDLVPPASAIVLAKERPDIPHDPDDYRGWESRGQRKRKNGKGH